MCVGNEPSVPGREAIRRITGRMPRRVLTLALSLAWMMAVSTALASAVPKEPTSAPSVDTDAVAMQLLDHAFDAASAMPLRPHIKNRSRAQEPIVYAALELDEPRRAERYAAEIANWRRGAAMAEIASYYAKREDLVKARELLDGAIRISKAHHLEDWRRDQIRWRIGKALIWMNEEGEATNFTRGLVSSEVGKTEIIYVEKHGLDAFDTVAARLDARIATNEFDLKRTALDTYTAIYELLFHESKIREEIEGKVRAGMSDMPVFIRVGLLQRLAAAAAEHEARDAALGFVGEASEWLGAARWRPEHFTPIASELAVIEHRLNEVDAAHERLEAAMAFYESRRDEMLDIDRASAVRPVAQAFAEIGDTDRAEELYLRALDLGLANPNSRPRAVDLAQTCVSMALHRYEPSSNVMDLLQVAKSQLKAPW